MKKTQTKKTRTKKTRAARDIRKKRLPRHHAIAFREAGHAVAAWERGIMLMPLSIFAVSRGAGRNVWNDALRNVDFEWVRTAGSPALARRLAAILLAGPVAADLYGPKLPRGPASAERIREARALLRAASGDSGADPRELFGRTLAAAKTFLKRRRVEDAVTALASVLLDRGTVRGGEAASIIESRFRA